MEWRLACLKGKANLVFPDQNGEFFPYSTSRDHLRNAQAAAGVVSSAVDQSMCGMPFAISVRVG
jgi:hypothetical protein